MQIQQYNLINYKPIIFKSQIKSTKNPINLYKMMRMYSKERHEKLPYLKAIFNCIDSMVHNCKMRIIKDNSGEILASYTYCFKKNRLGEKSMFIDALVRNRKKQDSKNIINKIYQDMKKIAINKNAKELSLYSKANESALRKNYEKLGFQKDEKEYIEGAYLMRVNTNNFINN